MIAIFSKFSFWGRNKKKYFWLDSSFLLIIAALIGIGTGFASLGFQQMIDFVHNLFFNGGGKIFYPLMGKYYVILLPTLGAFLVSGIVYYFARETKGDGVPEVINAVAEHDGILKPRLVVDKAITSSIILGSGGSAGKEGPVIQIGAAIGSTIGQLFSMPPGTTRTFLACGAAGGISAAFNAPIGGVLFAQELILGEFKTNNFILIVISSVSSAIISRIFIGNYPAFIVPHYELVSPGEMFFYLLLGILTGLFAVLYIKTLYKTGDLFSHIKMPVILKPALGGLLVGCIGLNLPQIFGVGYDTIELVLKNSISWQLVIILLLAKLIATSITLGSGSPGGDFAPGLYMGAMLGAGFGFLVNYFFPEITAPAGAYALVGMGGVLAGQYQAPVTAIIMLFEMTGDYKVVLPLMVVCVISSLVARGLYPETIYTEKLARRGLRIRQKQNNDIMAEMSAADVMTTDVITLDAGQELNEARQVMLKHDCTGFPVLKEGELIGIITYEDILNEIKQGHQTYTLEQTAGTELVTVYPHDTIRRVMEKMAAGDIGRLPVVNSDNPRELEGIISRSDIINAYALVTNREGG